MFVLLVLLTFVAALTFDYLVQRADARRAAHALEGEAGRVGVAETVPETLPEPAPSLEELTDIPPGLFLSPGHNWLQLESTGSVRLGTDRLAPALLGGLDRLQLLPAGSVVRRGDPLATLHFGDREIVLRAPLDGVIDEVNTLAAADPERLAHDPFQEGWLYRLRARGIAEALRGMRVAEEARAWMASELSRVRDFAARLGKGQRFSAVIQPGAAPVPVGIAGELGAGDWKDFSDRIFAG
ncbi:MAG: hypothetical protein D6702_01695 [Planctomycetota bacterium]|nr:MAG: hypothetical protein D6702_01695 [Planctomycetota bacterium]